MVLTERFKYLELVIVIHRYNIERRWTAELTGIFKGLSLATSGVLLVWNAE